MLGTLVRWSSALACGLLAVSLAASAADAPGPLMPKARKLNAKPFAATPARLARGRYLAEGVLSCFLCHSERAWDKPGAPPKAGRKGAGQIMRNEKDYLIVAPNITPDRATGAGAWPDDALSRAIREGVGHDGRALHPQMFYSSFRNLSDEDVVSVVVYLRSLPAVSNKLPPTRMPDDRRKEIAAKLAPITQPVPMPDQSTPLARGRYLIHLADCIGCHTSWHSDRMPGLFAGGNLIERGERKAFSTNLTPDPSGVPYDEAAFIRVIRTGKSGTLSPLMPWIALRNLNDADLSSIRVALRRLEPVAHYISNSAPPTHCPVCLQEHGLGDSNHMPELPKAIALDPKTLPDYVGRYRAVEDGSVVEVVAEGSGLVMIDAGKRKPLYAQSPTFFLAPDWGEPARFEREGKSGKFTRLVGQDVDDYVYNRFAGNK